MTSRTSLSLGSTCAAKALEEFCKENTSTSANPKEETILYFTATPKMIVGF